MKGVQGLIIAIVLGLIGAAVNLKYLSDQSKFTDKEMFINVRKGIKQGDLIRSDDLETFPVPKGHVGNLADIAYKEDMKGTIVGQRAMRDMAAGQLILQEDLRTAPQTDLQLKPGEVAVWVPVNNRLFVAKFVIPGRTQVSFRLPRDLPTPAGSSAVPSTSTEPEQVGPFDVLSVGNRQGSLDALKPQNIRPVQEDVLTLRAASQGGQLDRRTARVLDYLARTNNRPLDVVLHAETAAKKGP
ncbi:MAG: hypothetical protein K8T25_18850 [Planctomycetia bacterium]|nr:hypothetical protein [Planctomycetia bacterium]